MPVSANHLRPYQKLVVWREAHVVCLHIYKLTKNFPPDEKFGLVSQMRRAAASTPTNIAEGSTKHSPRERAHFYEIAATSLEELHYELLLSKDLAYISEQEFDTLDVSIRKISYLLFKIKSSTTTLISSITS
ncbi:four helix bundle protein [Candidatus Peregrinibacteria bacterium]|nr:four helix bundle protein [Candidatus Peregrinibacteria bacterium]MBI4129106.1 four helix bundle protein [Candidatus Peregrinibacteria bacterium]